MRAHWQRRQPPWRGAPVSLCSASIRVPRCTSTQAVASSGEHRRRNTRDIRFPLPHRDVVATAADLLVRSPDSPQKARIMRPGEPSSAEAGHRCGHCVAPTGALPREICRNACPLPGHRTTRSPGWFATASQRRLDHVVDVEPGLVSRAQPTGGGAEPPRTVFVLNHVFRRGQRAGQPKCRRLMHACSTAQFGQGQSSFPD